MNTLTTLSLAAFPALISAADARAQRRFREFFASNIRNANTRQAYARGVGDFLAWCDQAGVSSLEAVEPLHVATYIEGLTRHLSAPTVKQRLATIRMLFD